MDRVYKHLHKLTPFIPMAIKEMVRSVISVQEYDYAIARQMNANIYENEIIYPESRYCIAIIYDKNQDHIHYVSACQTLRISYKVIDILADDWVEKFRHSGCQAVLVWPSCSTTVIKQVYDNRLRILEHDLRIILFPSWQECWLTEHKPRLRDWLIAHHIPHPKTWVFYEKNQALEFSLNTLLPVVCKTATGAGGSGVIIIRNRRELKRIINQAFGVGLRPHRHDVFDRQRGFIFFQEYLHNVEEWRMVRIGDFYFGHRKDIGLDGMHSGSQRWSLIEPSHDLLDLLKKVTDISGFSSMDVDVFRSNDGRLFVNELQTVFGCNIRESTLPLYVTPGYNEGCYLWVDNKWVFNAGDYWRNHMCDLRVQHLIKILDTQNINS